MVFIKPKTKYQHKCALYSCQAHFTTTKGLAKYCLNCRKRLGLETKEE